MSGQGLPRKLRVLVLNQHYWPEVAATAQLLSDLCEDLAASGCDVSVICGQPSYRSVDHGILPAREVRSGVTIHRVWSYVPKQRGMLDRMLSYGGYFALSLGSALTTKRPDVCLVLSSPPVLLGGSGLLLRLLRDVPFVYSVQDLYPDVAVHLDVLKENSRLTRAIAVATHACYRAATAIVTLSDGMAGKLLEKGVAPERLHVIPNWADTQAIRERPRDNSFARTHGFAARFVVQYSGNLGLSQGLEAVVEAFGSLSDLPVTLALIGDGNAREGLARQVRERGLTNVIFLPPQPREILADVLASCDVGLVTMRRGVADDLVPCKLYGIMAAGRPVLAATEATSEVSRVVSDVDNGWVVPPEDPAAIARAVRAAFETTAAERRRLGRNSRAACAAHYARSVLTQRYLGVLEQAASGRALAVPLSHPATTSNASTAETSA